MGGSEIDSFWNSKGENPIKLLVGGGKTRDSQVPDIFLGIIIFLVFITFLIGLLLGLTFAKFGFDFYWVFLGLTFTKF